MIHGEKLAALANLTPRRLYQLAKDGKIPPPINGNFPMLASITALFAFYQRDAEEIQKEKLLKLTAERKMQELDLQIRVGEIHILEDVEKKVWSDTLSPARDGIMNLSRICAAPCNPQDVATATKVLDAYAARILKTINDAVPPEMPDDQTE